MGSRLEEIYSLFAECSHQEQLRVLETLPSLITRDFVGGLPAAVVPLLLSYLAAEDLAACVLVSRRWRRVVGDCVSCWRRLREDAGLSDTHTLTLTPLFPSIMSLTMAAQRHVRNIKTSFQTPRIMYGMTKISVSKSPGSNVFVDSFGNAVVCSLNSTTPTIVTSLVTSLRVDDQPQMMEGPSDIVWACHHRGDVLCATNQADWLRMTSSATNYWTDSQIVSPSFVQLTSCCGCGLICEIERKHVVLSWSGSFVELEQGARHVTRHSFAVNVKCLEENSNDYLPLLHIAMVPYQSRGMGACPGHYLLMQICSAVLVYSIDGERFVPSYVSTLAPTKEATTSLLNMTDLFHLSVSKSCILGLMYDSSLYMWSVDTLTPFSVLCLGSHLPNVSSYRCLAIGNIYSVIQVGGDMVYAVSSTSGMVIARTRCTGRVKAMLSQLWMNTFIGNSSYDFYYL